MCVAEQIAPGARGTFKSLMRAQEAITMKRNQVYDSREEANGEEGEAAGNGSAGADSSQNGTIRNASGKSRLRVGGLREFIAKTM